MSYIQNLAADVYAWTFLVLMGLFGGFSPGSFFSQSTTQ